MPDGVGRFFLFLRQLTCIYCLICDATIILCYFGNFMLQCLCVCSRYLNDSLINRNDRVGSIYSKLVYKQYTDDTYTTEIPTNPSFGYLGPLLRAEVGEVIKVHFWNILDISVTVHPHGVRYDKNKEGRYILIYTHTNSYLYFILQ